MKNIKIKLAVKTVASVLSFVFIFMSMLVLVVSADYVEPLYCVSDHFSKLKYNHNDISKYRFPQNIIGTCTHSAMSMLLSFYDFYWSDAFVPTIYEADGSYHQMGWENGIYNSTTNTVVETFTAYPEANAWDIWSGDFQGFADYYDFKYLQPYLMSIADREIVSSQIGIVGLLDFQVVRVLEEYLSAKQLGPERGVSVHIEYGFPTQSNLNASRETLFNTMKEKINEGHPVMFLGLDHIDVLPDFIDETDWGIYAHAMVAYDVIGNGENEDIILHTGWNGDETQYFNSTPYSSLNSAIWIEIDDEKLPHECTRKYRDYIDPNKTYCACQVYSTHPNHSNNHLYKDEIDSDNHFSKCHCGKISNIQPHDLTYSYYSETQHNESCSECEYHEVVNHEYNIPHSPTNTYHSLKCACGVISSETEEHYAYRYENLNKSLHTVYCKCEKEWTSPHVVESGSFSGGKKYALCIACKVLVTVGMTHHQSIGELPHSENGSFILPDGIIVLVDEDIEAYFNGTLEFIYPGDNSEAA